MKPVAVESTGVERDDVNRLTAELIHRGISPDDVSIADAFVYFENMQELAARDNIVGFAGDG